MLANSHTHPSFPKLQAVCLGLCESLQVFPGSGCLKACPGAVWGWPGAGWELSGSCLRDVWQLSEAGWPWQLSGAVWELPGAVWSCMELSGCLHGAVWSCLGAATHVCAEHAQTPGHFATHVCEEGAQMPDRQLPSSSQTAPDSSQAAPGQLPDGSWLRVRQAT